ncbi:VOC family protein [Alkalicoccus urumqiensis]|uniref:VOC family protein n=1 Tax=Alkalicoccus urumqiensis TaxID=1548213 RepID=UPI0015E61A3A|nr:VOC family protein [Alkalicoccus urumqiensis]
MSFHTSPAAFVEMIRLGVSDLTHSVQFYQDVLGFQASVHDNGTADLTAGGRTLVILEEGYTRPSEAREGLFHVAFLLPDRPSLGAFLTHLVQHRFPVQGASDHGVSEAIYLQDPDGNGIEVYRDRPATEWTWSSGRVHMTTEPLDAEAVAAQARAWNALPDETIIGHVHLQTSSLPAAKAFYETAFGMREVTSIGDHASFLSTASYHHHIALNTWSGPRIQKRQRGETGLLEMQFSLPGDAAWKSLQSAAPGMTDPLGVKLSATAYSS